MLEIKVCATSANVCVGFDVLGMALDLTNNFWFEKKTEFEYHGFEEKYKNKDNLVQKSYEYVFKKSKKEIIPVLIKMETNIPVERGLGSSSSLIVAGVFAANYYLGNLYNKNELLTICSEIEGHPDNVAPAIYGGLVASYKINDNYNSIVYPVSDDLKFILVSPPFPLQTSEARRVLPKSYETSDVVNNLSRIVNIPYAFKIGDLDLIKELFIDKIHEPYRMGLIPKANEIKELAEYYNNAFSISGSGSTLMIICKDLNIVPQLKQFGYEVRVLNVGSEVIVREI